MEEGIENGSQNDNVWNTWKGCKHIQIDNKSIQHRCKIDPKNASTNRRKNDQHVRTKYQAWSQNPLKIDHKWTKFDPKLVQRALGEGLGASLAPRTIKLRKCWFVGPNGHQNQLKPTYGA